MGVCGQCHAPPTLPPGKSHYALYRRLGGHQGLSGWVWKVSPPLGFDPQIVQPVASCYTDCSVLAQTYFYVFILFSVSLYFAINFRKPLSLLSGSLPTKSPCTIPVTVYCGAAVYICMLLLRTASSSTRRNL
jgi:hypothetical protein